MHTNLCNCEHFRAWVTKGLDVPGNPIRRGSVTRLQGERPSMPEMDWPWVNWRNIAITLKTPARSEGERKTPADDQVWG